MKVLLAIPNGYLQTNWINELNVFGKVDIDFASTSKDIISSVAKNKYDLVVCDNNLNDSVSGQTTLETIRINKTLPLTTAFILTSAAAADDSAIKSIHLKPDAFVTKPYSSNTIRRGIHSAIKNIKATHAIRESYDAQDYYLSIKQCSVASRSITANPADLDKNTDSAIKDWILHMTAELYTLVGRYAQSASFCAEQLSTYKPEWALKTLIRAYLEQGSFKEALCILQEHVSDNDHSVTSLQLMSECYLKMNQPDMAIQLLNFAVAKSPDNMHLYFNQGRAAQLAGDNEMAIRFTNKAIKLSKGTAYDVIDNYEIMACSAYDYCEDKKSECDHNLLHSAHLTLKEGVKTFPDKEFIRISSDLLRLRSLQYSGKQIKAADSMISWFLDNKDSLMLSNLGDYASIITRQILSMSQELPLDPSIKAGVISWVSAENQNTHLGKKINANTHEVKASNYFNEGRILFEQGNIDDAEVMFLKGINHMPRHVDCNIGLAQCCISIMRNQNRPIDDLINLGYRCLERLKAPAESDNYFKQYSDTMKALNDLSRDKFK